MATKFNKPVTYVLIQREDTGEIVSDVTVVGISRVEVDTDPMNKVIISTDTVGHYQFPEDSVKKGGE